MKMKLRILAFIAIVAMSVISPANARYFPAKKLLSECETESTINRAICNGYLVGANDAHELHTGLDEGTKKSISIPAGASIERLRKVFVKFVNDNPKDSQQDAASVVITAFAGTFPCK
jgi:hypothetical protein